MATMTLDESLSSARRRFDQRILKSEGCWTWTGQLNPFGYGKLYVIDGMVLAHRFAWAIHHGPLVAGQQVCHRCDNPPCVRLDHLFLGDAAANMADKCAKGRQTRGSSHGTHKLIESQVREIRILLAEGFPAAAIASRYGVSDVTVRHIRTGYSWGWLA